MLLGVNLKGLYGTVTPSFSISKIIHIALGSCHNHSYILTNIPSLVFVIQNYQ